MKRFILKIIYFLALIIIILVGFEQITSLIIVKDTSFIFEDSPKYIVVGHSHPQFAYNDSIIDDLKNVASAGESYFYTYHKTKFLLEKTPSVKTVFVEFTNNSIAPNRDGWTWDCYYMRDKFKSLAPLIDFKDKMKMMYHSPSCYFSTSMVVISERIDMLLNNDLKFLNKLGGYKVHEKKEKSKKLEINKQEQRLKKINAFDGQTSAYSAHSVDYLKKIIDLCKQKKKNVILIRTPQRKDYEFWQNEELFQKLKTVELGDLIFLDFSKFDLKDDEYYDSDHLNDKGANRFSRWFNIFLKDNQDKFMKLDFIESNEL